MSNKVTKDYVTLELKCVKCDEIKQIPQKQKHATNVCLDCQRARQREYAKIEAEKEGRRAGVMGRFPYPLEGKWSYPNQKFNAMAKIMGHITDRDEWIAQIRINYYETINNPLVMEWINAHKGDDDRPAKGQKKINKEYPDTRGMTWEEYQRGLGDDDVDS
jgi:phage FluMu protein Com